MTRHLLTVCVTMKKSLNFTEPQFFHLLNVRNTIIEAGRAESKSLKFFLKKDERKEKNQEKIKIYSIKAPEF